MNRNCFWLTEEQFSRLQALLPTDTRGKPSDNDRRVIGGIVHVLKSGGRWVDAPHVYGPSTAGELLLEPMPKSPILHAAKGYDTHAIRHKVEGKGTMPTIPPKANRRWKNCFSPFLYRDRNADERMFGRLKDFRRIATRYDRSATNFLAAACLAATVTCWL